MLDHIIENAPIGILVINDKGYIEYVNHTMTEISGTSREVFKSINVYELPTYREMGLDKKIRDAFAGARYHLGPLEYISVSGNKKTIRTFTVNPVMTGETKKVILYIEDLTNKYQTERLVMDTDISIVAISDKVKDGVITFAQSGTIVDVNKKLCEIFECNKESLIGSGIDILEFKQEYMKRRLLSLRNEDGFIFESVGRSCKGRPISLEISVNAFHINSELQFIAFVRDITEAKEILFKEIYSQKMQAIGVFASNIAHNFNNVLSSLFGFLDFIRRYRTNPDNEFIESVSIVEREALAASKTIKRMLKFARRISINFEKVNVNDLIDESMKFVITKGSDGVEIKKNLGQDVPAARADLTLLKHALMNMFMITLGLVKKNGMVYIQTSELHLPDERALPFDTREDRYVAIEFKFDGGHIPERDMHMIYEPFYTLNGKNIGLSLSFIYGTMKEHSGYVYFSQGQEGLSTSIEMFLPCYRD